MYTYDQIKAVHLELTERCQAACPMCPRTDNDLLSNAELSLEDCKKIFSESFLKQIDLMSLCGNFGEPIVAKDCLEIVKYFRQVNPNMFISINTNAGARSKEWWTDLANTLGRKGVVKFGIDGLQDTNHIYRVNVKWENVFNNAKHFLAAGGRAWWDYIAFEHNEHQIEEANKIADQMGFEKFRVKKSYRFGMFNGVDIRPPRSMTNSAASVLKKDKEFFDKTPINCKVAESKEIFISAEGLLFPCCWLGGTLYNTKIDNYKEEQIWSLIEDKDNIDCKKHTIEHIMSSDYLKQIEQSWTKQSIEQGKMRVCALQCNAQYDMFKAQYQ